MQTSRGVVLQKSDPLMQGHQTHLGSRLETNHGAPFGPDPSQSTGVATMPLQQQYGVQ